MQERFELNFAFKIPIPFYSIWNALDPQRHNRSF